MAIQDEIQLLANLGIFPPHEALQWAASSKLDGRLEFRRSSKTVTLYFQHGRIVGAASDLPLESFGQHLFANGLSPTAEHSPKRLGPPDALAHLTEKQISEAKISHRLDIACSVARWRTGVVTAYSIDDSSRGAEQHALDPLFVSLEAARRTDEVDRIRLRVPHDGVFIRKTTESGSRRRTPAEQRIAEFTEETTTVGALHSQLGGCKYSLLLAIDELLTAGELSVVAAGEKPERTSNPSPSLTDVLGNVLTPRPAARVL